MPTNIAKHRSFLVGGCVAGLVFSIGLCFRSSQPIYVGHPLSYWFNELPLTIASAGSYTSLEQMSLGRTTYGSRREKPSVTLEAIRKIGTSGLPFIIGKLTRDEAPFMNWARCFASKYGFSLSFFPDPRIEQAQAVTALLVLSPLPSESIQELQGLSQNSSSNVAMSAGFVLMAGTNNSLNRVIARYR